MSWIKSVLDVIANVFGFITQYFKEKNERPVKERKIQNEEEAFKNEVKTVIKKQDIKKIRDLLSE
jgi:hypothetical protein